MMLVRSGSPWSFPLKLHITINGCCASRARAQEIYSLVYKFMQYFPTCGCVECLNIPCGSSNFRAHLILVLVRHTQYKDSSVGQTIATWRKGRGAEVIVVIPEDYLFHWRIHSNVCLSCLDNGPWSLEFMLTKKVCNLFVVLWLDVLLNFTCVQVSY